jgi:UDP-N-acetylmuramate dehydrogenase
MVALKNLTTMRVGGTPLFYSRPRTTEDLLKTLHFCRDKKMRFKILGGGSNLLAEDGRLDFGVIHICAPAFNWISTTDRGTIKAGAGVRISHLLNYAKLHGLGGLEFLAGIPGTVGGTIAGNAGAQGCSIGDNVRSLSTVSPEGRQETVTADELDFSYRHCSLDECIITEAELKVTPRNPELIRRQIRKNLLKRQRSQPVSEPTAGCVFKNPPGEAAGRLLDLCGIKGVTIGGAEISPLHANFICNVSNASSDDIYRLISLMRQKVKENFDIELKLELTCWDEDARVA